MKYQDGKNGNPYFEIAYFGGITTNSTYFSLAHSACNFIFDRTTGKINSPHVQITIGYTEFLTKCIEESKKKQIFEYCLTSICQQIEYHNLKANVKWIPLPPHLKLPGYNVWDDSLLD